MGGSGEEFLYFALILVTFLLSGILILIAYLLRTLFRSIRFPVALMIVYSFISFVSALCIYISYSDVNKMNSQKVYFNQANGNSAPIQFKTEAPGSYSVYLVFDDAKTNNMNLECQYFGVEKNPKKEDCVNLLIFRKITLDYANKAIKSFSSQYPFALNYSPHPSSFELGFLYSTTVHEQGLLLDSFTSKYPGQKFDFKVTLNANTEEILASKAAIMITPSTNDYFAPTTAWIAFSVVAVSFLIAMLVCLNSWRKTC